MRRGLETEHPAMVTQRSGPQGKPGEKWLRDLTPDNATAPAPDPTRWLRRWPGGTGSGREQENDGGPGVNVFLIETVAAPAEGGIHERAQAAAGCHEEDDAEGSALLKMRPAHRGWW